MVDAGTLEELASLVGVRTALYAVGGYCRDALLGVTPRDLDVCAALGVAELKNLLAGTRFSVGDKSMRLGTACVKAEGFSAEYTAFRTDSYPAGSGVHRPADVTFTQDMRTDALRRDFTVNAIYFNPLNGEYTDFFGGKEDVAARKLRAVRDPDSVFGEDGLRVLRLVRFAAELGFEPDADTFAAAKRNAHLVADIVPERIFAELDKIFVADSAYPELGVKDGHVRGLRLLDELGLVDLLLPELAALKGLEQPKKYHVYDAYRHSVEAFAVCSPAVRWAALLHDVGKRVACDLHGNMHGHDAIGAAILPARLAALGMPPRRAERVCRLVEKHMVDLKGDMSENKLRLFIAANADIMDDLIELKDADAYATKGERQEEQRIGVFWRVMHSDGTPLSVRDLPVNGNDAEKAGLKGREVGEALDALLREAVINPVLRDREKALSFLAKRVAKH